MINVTEKAYTCLMSKWKELLHSLAGTLENWKMFWEFV